MCSYSTTGCLAVSDNSLGLMLLFRVRSSPDLSRDLAELIIICLSLNYQSNCALLLGGDTEF